MEVADAVPEPDLEEFAPQPTPPQPVRVAGLFPTAAAALAFAGQLATVGWNDIDFGTSAGATGWWVLADAPLATVRELIAATGGQTYVDVDGALVRDRGWGHAPVAGDASVEPPGRRVGVITLVRVAGLTPAKLPAPPELVVLVPGGHLSWVVQRALDLGLTVGYRPALRQPLFATDMERTEETIMEVRVRATGDSIPPSFVSALEHHPHMVPCRTVGDRLLIQHPFASPLPDAQLARLPEADSTGATWVLAAGGNRCARLVPQGPLSDGAVLIRLADGYQLIDIEPTPSEALEAPEPPVLRLVRSRTRGAAVDAILLNDADIGCLPALLEGHPLADIALLARGRDQHLLLAPGGLLDRLPLGEPLYCIGPGLLYLPIGYRIRPELPPSARRAMFPTDNDTAIVLQPEAALRLSLLAREPVWAIWAGQPPPLDIQLPHTAGEALAEVDRIVGPAETTPAITPERDSAKDNELHRVQPEPDWWAQAFALERAGNLVEAARLHEQHNQLLRAAHLYERAAREGNRAD